MYRIYYIVLQRGRLHSRYVDAERTRHSISRSHCSDLMRLFRQVRCNMCSFHMRTSIYLKLLLFLCMQRSTIPSLVRIFCSSESLRCVGSLTQRIVYNMYSKG